MKKLSIGRKYEDIFGKFIILYKHENKIFGWKLDKRMLFSDLYNGFYCEKSIVIRQIEYYEKTYK